jgi:RHS repeat-associated protein
VVEEWSGNGPTLLVSYVYGAGLDPVSMNRDNNGTPTSLEPVLYLADAHSGVRQVVSTTGAVLLMQQFDAFGVTVALSNPGGLANVIGYRGERFDTTLGQYFLRARYYVPRLGRFTGVDPFAGTYGDPRQLMRYGYTGADPVNAADPSGKFLVSSLVVVGAKFSGRLKSLSTGLIVRMFVYETLAYLTGFTVFAAFFNGVQKIYGWWHSTPATKGGYEKLTVPVTLIRIVEADQGFFLSPNLSAMRTSIGEASQFWEQYGIALKIQQEFQVTRPNAYHLEVSDWSRTNLDDLVDEYAAAHPNTVIIISSGSFENAGVTTAATAKSQKGFVTNASFSTTVAHEFGHVVCGLYHADWQTNIMHSDLNSAVGNAGVMAAYASQSQVTAARNQVQLQGFVK